MFNLPNEIIQKIFEFDSTYREIFNKVIEDINSKAKFICYE